jgi:hypothetical protein
MTSAKGSLGVDRLRGRGHKIRYAPETMESAFFQSTMAYFMPGLMMAL